MDREVWIPLLAMASLVLLLAVRLTYLVRQAGQTGRASHGARAAVAEARGWRYESGGVNRSLLYRLHGADRQGVAWTLDSRRYMTRIGRPAGGYQWFTRWRCDAFRAVSGSEVLIAPRLPEVSAVVEHVYGERLQLEIMLPTAAQRLARLPEILVGSSPFRERFAVYATYEATAGRVLAASIESHLLAWPPPRFPHDYPWIFYWQEGLEVALREPVFDAATMERLADLGQALLEQISKPNGQSPG